MNPRAIRTHCMDCSVRLTEETGYRRIDRAHGFRARCRRCLQVDRRKRADAVEVERRAKFRATDTHCAICKSEETVTRGGRVRRPTVDHDHETGRIRGVLCSRCNTGIGMFSDDPELLREAILYLNVASIVGAMEAALGQHGPTLPNVKRRPRSSDAEVQFEDAEDLQLALWQVAA